jgi:hypothetical protein
LVAISLLVLIDWRRGWRVAKYLLFGTLVGSVSFLGVLAAIYVAGYAAKPAVAKAPPTYHSNSAHHFIDSLGSTITWLLRSWPITTALVVSLSLAIGLSLFVLAMGRRRSIVQAGGTPPDFITNPARRLVITKVLAGAAFTLFTAFSGLFFYLIVAATPSEKQPMVELLGGGYLILLNWMAFKARDWKQRVQTGVATFALVFIFIPMQGENAALFPRMVVRSLGLGDVHATSIALSGLQCSTLASYGVDCESKKDIGISLTNVNIIDRLGSTVLIELQVRRTPEPSTAPPKAQTGNPASGVIVPTARKEDFKTLVLPEAQTGAKAKEQIAGWYPCNKLLLEKLRANDPGKADELVCVTLSVPKEQILGNTTNGPATYIGNFSQFVQFTKGS